MPATAQRDFLDPAVLGRLSRLELCARGPMEGNVSGRHQSPHRGASVEFAEYRKYVAGDDPRHLDWRVVARSDRFYLKEFEADTNLRCHLIVDTSGSMAFGNKLDYARRLAGTIAYLAMLQGDAVGLACCREDISLEIPARRNPVHLRHVFDALTSQQPSGPTGMVRSLHTLADKIRQRALIVVMSDLFQDPEELLHSFRHLHFRKHDLVVFHLLDREEIDFEFDRPIRFTDMETSGSIVAEPTVIQARYKQALATYLDRLRSGCFEFNVDYRVVTTDQSYEKILADFLLARMKGK